MGNRIFDVVDNKVVLKPEALLIPPYKEIWENDKSKDKIEAYKIIKIIWFFCSPDSPYYQNTSEEERLQIIINDVINDKKYKPSKEILEGIEKYKSLYSTPELRLLDAVEIAIFKMDKFFRGIQSDEDNIKKVSDSIVAMPKLMQSLKDARRIAESSDASTTKVRGAKELGLYE